MREKRDTTVNLQSYMYGWRLVRCGGVCCDLEGRSAGCCDVMGSTPE